MKKQVIICLVLVAILIFTYIAFMYKKSDYNPTFTYDDITWDDITWDDIESTNIIFSDNSVTGDEQGYIVNDNYVTIKSGGSYYLSGTYDGYIVIDSESEVYLVLNNLTINAPNSSAINVVNAKKVFIKLEENSINTLNSGTNEEAAIYSKDDLVITGDGTLNIISNNHGIISNDSLQIISGTISINSQNDGIKAKDYIAIKSGAITINSSSDGIKTTNDKDSTLGYIVIDGGSFDIEANNDALTAASSIIINGGDFSVKTGAGYTKTSKAMDFNNWNNMTTDTESKKGFKALGLIKITGGTFDLNTEDDGIHSDNDVLITNGNLTIKSTDDALHADGKLTVDGGIFDITASEGIEATYVIINNGNITISATDDGINAGNKSNKYTTTIEINGGNIKIVMASGDTDGIDSNGNLIINGGTIDVTCNSPFDYDGKAEYNGGTLIVNGSKVNSITNQFGGQGQRPNNFRMR